MSFKEISLIINGIALKSEELMKKYWKCINEKLI